MFFNSESHPSHVLNKWKFGISNPWCCENLLHFTSTLIPAVLMSCLGTFVGFWVSVFTSEGGRARWSGPFPISQVNQGVVYLTLIEVCGRKWDQLFVSQHQTTMLQNCSLCLTILIALDSYTGALKIKCAHFAIHRYTTSSRRHRVKQLRGCGVHFSCVKALTLPCVEALSGQRAFQATMNSSSVIRQHRAIKLLLRTRAHKKDEDKTK